jgi:hypothetical protein
MKIFSEHELDNIKILTHYLVIFGYEKAIAKCDEIRDPIERGKIRNAFEITRRMLNLNIDYKGLENEKNLQDL